MKEAVGDIHERDFSGVVKPDGGKLRRGWNVKKWRSVCRQLFKEDWLRARRLLRGSGVQEGLY